MLIVYVIDHQNPGFSNLFRSNIYKDTIHNVFQKEFDTQAACQKFRMEFRARAWNMIPPLPLVPRTKCVPMEKK